MGDVPGHMPSLIEFMQALAAILACGVIPFAMTGYPCCCGGGSICAACTEPGDDVELVISGAAANVCSAALCSARFDGTYALILSYLETGTCRWGNFTAHDSSEETLFSTKLTTIAGPSCGGGSCRVRAVVTQSGSDYLIRGEFSCSGNSTETYTFENNIGTTKPVCGDWSAYSVAFSGQSSSVSGGPACDLSGATCELTVA